MNYLLEEKPRNETQFLGFIETIDFIFTKKQLLDVVRHVVRAFAYNPPSMGYSHYMECRPDNVIDALISILFRQIVANVNSLEMTHENIVKCLELYRKSKQFIEMIIPELAPSSCHPDDLRRMFGSCPVWHDHRSPGGPNRCTYGIPLYDTIRDKILTHDSQLMLLWENVLSHDGMTIKPSLQMLETNEHNVLELVNHPVCDGVQLNRGEYPVGNYFSSKLVDRCANS